MSKFILCALFIIHAFEVIAQDSVATYGDLYMVDQTNDIKGPHRFSIGAGLDTANPMRDIYNIQIGYAYGFYDFFEVGAVGKMFMSSASALKKRVDQEFDLIGLQVEGQKPIWASYLSFAIIPIKGRVNFFRKYMIPMSVAVSAGPGLRSTDERGQLYGFFWAIHNRFYFNSTYSLELNFTQELEAAFEDQEKTTRSQLNLLLGLSF